MPLAENGTDNDSPGECAGHVKIADATPSPAGKREKTDCSSGCVLGHAKMHPKPSTVADSRKRSGPITALRKLSKDCV